MNAIKKPAPKLQPTILPALFEAWTTLKRKKDSTAIAEQYGWSKPTIDAALNYGHVKTERVTEDINHFFKTRQERERKQVKELLNPSTEENA